METTKPIVQVILPRHGPSDDQPELSRPPSAFPIAEIDRLRAQEGGNDEMRDEVSHVPIIVPESQLTVTLCRLSQSSGRSTPSQPGDHSSQDPAPAPPQYDDPIPYHPKPSVDLPPYEPLPDTFQSPPEKSTPKAGLSLVGSASGMATDEKRRLDLEAVTSAVDHAYTAAPQFDDQRSEMRPSGSKSATMVNEGTAMGRKMSLKDEKELNKLFDQIERAHGHSKFGILSLSSKEMLTLGKLFSELPDQSTELDADRAAERTTRKVSRSHGTRFSRQAHRCPLE